LLIMSKDFIFQIKLHQTTHHYDGLSGEKQKQTLDQRCSEDH